MCRKFIKKALSSTRQDFAPMRCSTFWLKSLRGPSIGSPLCRETPVSLTAQAWSLLFYRNPSKLTHFNGYSDENNASYPRQNIGLKCVNLLRSQRLAQTCCFCCIIFVSVSLMKWSDSSLRIFPFYLLPRDDGKINTSAVNRCK